MKLIQANPKSENKQTIYTALNAKERDIRDKGTTFYKDKKDKWKHKKYDGWVIVSLAEGNILFAKVQSRNEIEEDKIFEAFVGYLTRHCGALIDTLTVYYR